MSWSISNAISNISNCSKYLKYLKYFKIFQIFQNISNISKYFKFYTLSQVHSSLPTSQVQLEGKEQLRKTQPQNPQVKKMPDFTIELFYSISQKKCVFQLCALFYSLITGFRIRQVYSSCHPSQRCNQHPQIFRGEFSLIIFDNSYYIVRGQSSFTLFCKIQVSLITHTYNVTTEENVTELEEEISYDVTELRMDPDYIR